MSGVFSWLDRDESAQVSAVVNMGQSTTEALLPGKQNRKHSVTRGGTWKAACLYDLAEMVEIRSKGFLMQKFI